MSNVKALQVSESLPLAALEEKQLAELANAEHEKATRAIAVALRHALSAGEALNTVREKIASRYASVRAGDQAWAKWLEANFRGPRRTAVAYMRLARWRIEIERTDAQTVTEAGDLLMRFGQQWIDNRLGDEAKALAEKGLNRSEIGALLHASRYDISRALDGPRRRSSYRQIRDEQLASEKAMRKLGGDLWESWRQIRLELARLQRLADREKAGTAKTAIRLAQSYLHHAEDSLRAAAKASAIAREGEANA